MSNINNFDFIPPLQDECLYSWIIRTLKYYSPTGQIDGTSSKDFLNLFGISNATPRLYYQDGMKYLLNNHDFGNSTNFSSIDSIISDMTVLPFYLAFKEEDDRLKIYRKVCQEDNRVEIMSRLKIKQGVNNVEGRCYIKFCPICFSEPGEKCLKIEHQVPGNYICERHNVGLKRIEYLPRWSFLDFFQQIDNAQTIELDVTQRKVAISISKMIHQVFIEGLRISLSDLKYKIRSKMVELGYLDKEYNFFDYKMFLDKLDNGLFFEFVPREKVVFNTIYDTKVAVNPIYYLLLVEFLFDNLEALYSYSPKGIRVKISKEYRTFAWKVSKHSRVKTGKINPCLKKYEIIGETNQQIIVKHISCGRCFYVDRQQKQLVNCPYCVDPRGQKYINFSEKEDVMPEKYTRYLSANDFGKKYGKKEKQIRNYCRDGRIPDVIQVGTQWLIPETSEYPRRKSYKTGKKED